MTQDQYVGENLESGGASTTVTLNQQFKWWWKKLSTITIGDTSFSVGVVVVQVYLAGSFQKANK